MFPPKREINGMVALALTGKACKQSLIFKSTLGTKEAGRTCSELGDKGWSSQISEAEKREIYLNNYRWKCLNCKVLKRTGSEAGVI